MALAEDLYKRSEWKYVEADDFRDLAVDCPFCHQPAFKITINAGPNLDNPEIYYAHNAKIKKGEGEVYSFLVSRYCSTTKGTPVKGIVQ